MSKRIQSIRGMHDRIAACIVHCITFAIELATQNVLQQYGYQEIRMPLLEQTELFKRSSRRGYGYCRKRNVHL